MTFSFDLIFWKLVVSNGELAQRLEEANSVALERGMLPRFARLFVPLKRRPTSVLLVNALSLEAHQIWCGDEGFDPVFALPFRFDFRCIGTIIAIILIVGCIDFGTHAHFASHMYTLYCVVWVFFAWRRHLILKKEIVRWARAEAVRLGFLTDDAPARGLG